MPDPEPYLTEADLRTAWTVLADDTLHPDEDLEDLVAEFEELVERARGVAYRVRTRTLTVTATGWGSTMLADPVVNEVTALSVEGTALTAGQINALTISANGDLSGGSWCRGAQLVVTYTHGLEAPPPAILRACKEFVRAKRLATTSNQPRNTISYQDPDTGYSYRESTANWEAGRYTGLLVVDDAINSVRDYRLMGGY